MLGDPWMFGFACRISKNPCFFLLHIHIYPSPGYIRPTEIQEGKIQLESGHSESNSMSSSTASALATLLFIYLFHSYLSSLLLQQQISKNMESRTGILSSGHFRSQT